MYVVKMGGREMCLVPRGGDRETKTMRVCV